MTRTAVKQMISTTIRCINCRVVCRLVVTVCLLSVTSTVTDVIRGPVEVCNREYLNISCDAGEAVLIETALYGRMRVGRCVHQTLGYVACQKDVVRFVEMWCSGRQRCQVLVPDDDIYSTTPCPTDTTSYLETTYRCIRIDGRPATDVRQSSFDADLLVPGRSNTGHHAVSSLQGGSRPAAAPGAVATGHETCRKYGRGIHRNATAVGSPGGYISIAPGDGSVSATVGQSSPVRPGSTDFDDVIVGTSGCPWVIEALPGQRVNLTLLDFMQQRRVTTSAAAAGDGTSSHRQMSPRPVSAGDVCYEIAHIRDGDRTKTIQSCYEGRHNRRRHVYLSVTSTVELIVYRSNIQYLQGTFLFHYTAVGCPSLSLRLSPYATVHQTMPSSGYSTVGSTAIVRCNSTNQSWTLTCAANNTWMTLSASATGSVSAADVQLHQLDDCPSTTAASTGTGTSRGNRGRQNSWPTLDVLLSSEESLPYGVFVAVALGVALGVFLGGFFLALIAVNRRRHLDAAASTTAVQFDINDYGGVQQHELHDVTSGSATETYMTSSSNVVGGHQWLTLTSHSDIHKFGGDVVVDSGTGTLLGTCRVPQHHATCRMLPTTAGIDCMTLEAPLTLLTSCKQQQQLQQQHQAEQHYASNVRGMTLLGSDGGNEPEASPSSAKPNTTSIRYYDI